MPYTSTTMPSRARAGRALRRALAALLAVLVLASMLALTGQAEPASALSGHVQGTVFRDFNQNGVFNATAGTDGLVDAPLKGVTATAYNAAGTAVGSSVTTAAGTYDITVTGAPADGTPLRVQFSGIPAGFTDSFNGTANSTSVQFTTVGATGVNFALHKTTDYSGGLTGTPLITAIQSSGSAALNYTTAGLNNSIRNAPAITAILPSAAVYTAASTAATSLATFNEVGAVWGVAVQSLGRVAAGDRFYIYASAMTKRHSDWGPRGIDGLYRLDVTVSSAGVVTRNAIASYDLTATGVNYGTVNTLTSLNASGATSEQAQRDMADRQTGTAGVQSLDEGAWAAAGKVGIGGIAYDNGRLYVTNLNQKTIVSYDITNFAAAPTVITPSPALTADERPWALAINDGSLYLGVTNAATPATGARVITRALSGGAFSTVLTVPLNYSRGIAWAADTTPNPTTGQPAAQWHAWTDDYATLWNNANTVVTFFRAWAQPLLTGLSFDDGGNVGLGFADRFSMQTGTDSLWPTGANTAQATTVIGLPVGDVLYAGLGATGTLAIENSGATTNGTLTVTTPGLDQVLRTPGYGAEGPAAGQTARQNIQHGGREFFEDSVRWNGTGGINTAEGVVHDETALGAVAMLAGSQQMTSTSFDAAVTYNAAGNRFLSLVDGRSINGFDQYQPGVPSFGKDGGIGGVAFLLDDAPVEIGNRVWYDADLDGIQDADEPAINGAPVQLWTADASGNPVTQLATTTTATTNGQAGTYFFRTADAPTGGTTGFVKNADYVVVFPSGTSTAAVTLVWPTATVPPGYTGLLWSQMVRTTATAVGSTTITDSNPNVATGRALVSVGGMGENDHSIDAGWYGMSSYRLEKTIVGTAAPGATFTLNVDTATNFRGDNVRSTGGAVSNPIVDTLSYSLSGGQTVTTTELVPYGTVLTFSESNTTSASVAFAPFTGTDDTGRIVVTPAASGSETKVTATNSLTAITVTKALSTAVTLPAGTTFPVEYTINGGAVQTIQVTVGAANAVTIPGVPWGSTVRLRENLVGPFSWGGYVWANGTWAQGSTNLVADADRWITVTAPSSTTALALTLTNYPYTAPAMPFAGGLASDLFTIGGALVLLVAAGLGVWQYRVRRKPRRVAAHRWIAPL